MSQPPIVFPNYPLVQPGAPSGAPGNAPVAPMAMTASGIPLAGMGLGCEARAAATHDAMIGPELRDIAPPSRFPLWMKLLAGFTLLGVIVFGVRYASRRR